MTPEPPVAAPEAPHLRRFFPNASSGAADRVCEEIVNAGTELGFARIGFVDVEPFTSSIERLEQWLARGFHGQMQYMDQERSDPRRLLRDARSMIVVALVHPRYAKAGSVRDALIANYAGGPDYHDVIKDKLWALAQACANIIGKPLNARACVDTAPLLEREAARRASIGFIGKSTMLIVPGAGSYVLLGELLIDVPLSQPGYVGTKPLRARQAGKNSMPDTNAFKGCGECTACLDACPTQAFVKPFELDARRCISYLTIEHRSVIQRQLRSRMGAHVFGCDICQSVCPYNHSRKLPRGAAELERKPELDAPSLLSLLTKSNAEHRRLVKGTALSRVSRPRLQRNAAIALGNLRDDSTLPALIHTLAHHTSALVRGHAAWALGQFDHPSAQAALATALTEEQDPVVREELEAAMAEQTRRLLCAATPQHQTPATSP